MTPTFHKLIIKDVKKETEDTVSIAFDVPSTLETDYKFTSGQYLTLKAVIDNEDVRRSYSLSSAPFENEWRVAIKQVENGKFSTFANSNLKAGMELEVMTPAGNFTIETNNENKKSYVLFAAGSGITPVISIAKSILNDEPNSNVTLVYGNKGFGTIIYREELEALKNEHMDTFRIVHVFSRESLGNEIQKGRINKEKTTELHTAFFKNEPIDSVYICGPEDMIHGVKDSLIENGVAENAIHFELFTAPSSKENKTTAKEEIPNIESNVSIIIDDDTIELNLTSSGQNILDAAQEAGADVPFACKGGVCCTCKAKIIEGTAIMDVNYALEPDEVEAGYILTCQAHPTSDKLIISFDE